MTDADGDGIYEGSFQVTVNEDMLAGDNKDEIQFKVRGYNDSSWADSWGEYEADYERTYNSQTNCSIKNVKVGDVIVEKVTLDTNGSDFTLWPVAYSEDTASLAAAKAAAQLGTLTDYYFFDNSVTQYGKVGAYWWTPSENAPWPGSEITQVEGTDIWAVKYDAGTTVIIFNNLVADADYSVTNPKAQTENIDVSSETNAGNIFVPDQATELVSEEGAVKKIDGAWKTFESTATVVEYSVASTDPTDPTDPEGTEKVSKLENYETTQKDYIFFDNSETKWDTVYAYWWSDGFERTYDLENNDWGWGPTVDEETGETVNQPTKFPGTAMTQVEGTDIWQLRIPFNAKHIIFSSGVSDDEIHAGVTGYQTADLDFDSEANAGQIYTIDTSVEAVAGKGIEKTKYKYNAGSWSDYDGEFNSETLNPENVLDDPKANEDTGNGDDESSEDTETIGDNSNTGTGTGTGTGTATTTTTTTTDVPQTGDVAMAVAFISVAAAALGAVVLATKKRERN